MALKRASASRVDALVSILIEIGERKDRAPELVARFQSSYRELALDQRAEFFDALLRRVEIARADLESPLADVGDASDDDPVEWTRRLSRLRKTLESPRLRAFRRFLTTRGGLPLLLEMRADVLAIQRESGQELGPLEEEIAHLFDSWFQSDFLFLREVTLQSSFQEIKFLKEHDMVHPMASLDEMGARLAGDRRLFALYHRVMAEEPIVFIEVALTNGIARSIHQILDGEPNPKTRTAPDTAVFYSINNTQNGLARLGLGKALIFRVVELLRADVPGIRTFATLSPLPGLWERYLEPILLESGGTFALTRDRVASFFSASARRELTRRRLRNAETENELETKDFQETLHAILSDPDWIDDATYVRWLEKPLAKLAYFYIASEQNDHGTPLNPVAAFHLGNGARVTLKDVNFGANRSQRGLKESCGVMVNFVYSKSWLQEIGSSMKSLLTGSVK